MNAATKSELTSALAEIARNHPDWRFGQLVANVAGWTDENVWDVEDESLLMAARAHLDQIADAAEE